MKEKLPTKMSEKIRFILSVLVFLAFVPLTIWGIPKVMALSDPVARENLQQYFASKGIGGWLIFLVVQILQVVVAMIPGEPIEICAGLLYGPVWGTLSCMLGILIGSLIVYALVKKLGMPIVSVFIDPDRLQNLWFVRDESRFEKIAFLLFFIPGTPKDLLTWAAGLLKINPLRFFLFSTILKENLQSRLVLILCEKLPPLRRELWDKPELKPGKFCPLWSILSVRTLSLRWML